MSKFVGRGAPLIIGSSVLALCLIAGSSQSIYDVAAPAPALAKDTPAVVQPAATQVAPANGTLGFVVSYIDWGLGPDGSQTNCPQGLTTLAEPYLTGVQDAERNARTGTTTAALKACEFPAEAGPDPRHRTVAGTDTKVFGLDLDGQDSRRDGKARVGTCAHDDFHGVDGSAGIDNQFYRAVGCSTGWQSTGGKLGIWQTMFTGVWGILIEVKGVHNLVNQKDVQVGIYANADPIALSAARSPLAYASYNPDQNPRFRAETHGRIVNGELITDPINVRFHANTNTMWLERPLDAARLRLKLMPDGSLDGVMAGYTKVDELYDFVVGYRNGKDGKGNLSRQRFGSAHGSAGSAGITCNGIYHAMKQLADGERDPKTGACSAISNAYKIKALPAFVLEKPAGAGVAVARH